MGEAQAESRHVVAIPFPLPGHVSPMLQLCRVLVYSLGCTVTFVNTHRNAAHLAKILGERDASESAPPASESAPMVLWEGRMRVLTVHDGMHETPARMTWDYVRALLRAFAGSLSDAVDAQRPEILRLGAGRVACVLADVYLGWAQDLAAKLRAPRVALWTSLAAELQVYLHASDLISEGKLPFKAPEGRSGTEEDMDDLVPGRRMEARPAYHRVEAGQGEVVEVPGIGELERKDFPSFLQIEDASDVIFSFYVEQVRRAREAALLFINTIPQLEERVLGCLGAHAIGPLFLLEQCALPHTPAPPSIYQWLDRHPPQSVLYVAFGATSRIPPAELRELLAGLEASRLPFLLSRSGGAGVGPLHPPLSGRGLLVEWAPQALVLQHPSIAGFLSHCGWNSTLESLSAGVPMLGCPLATDQVLTCKLLVSPWQVGMELVRPAHAEGLIDAEQVARLSRELVQGEKGRSLYKRAQQWKTAAKSIVNDGSSHQALRLFVQQLDHSEL